MLKTRRARLMALLAALALLGGAIGSGAVTSLTHAVRSWACEGNCS